MATLPPWTAEVSERLMDIQRAAEQQDQRLIPMIHETQAYLTELERRIVGYCTTVRTGTPPRWMRDTLDAA